MSPSDFPAAVLTLIDSRQAWLRTDDTGRAAWTLPSSQQICPVALLPLTPESPLPLCG
jgi:hypothetical protein